MSSIATIMIFLAILVVSVIAISIVQKREREKAERLRQINQYRFRINNAVGALNNLSQQPIGAEARTLMLQYALANAHAIKKLSSDDLKNNNMLKMLNSSLENINTPADAAKLSIPADMALLTKQINQLSNLANFLHKLKKSNAISKELVPKAIANILSLISESKICAYIKQGQQSLEKNELVTAQTLFATAQEMLDKTVNKNNRLKNLDADLKKLIQGSEEHVEFLGLSDSNENHQTEEPNSAEPTAEGTDGLFGPKKKW